MKVNVPPEELIVGRLRHGLIKEAGLRIGDIACSNWDYRELRNFRVAALEEAVALHGSPGIFDTDQGLHSPASPSPRR
jgi:hypothetical protein